MANQRHADILQRDGVARWNRWRKEEPGIKPDLRGADLSGATLRSADLHEADLSEANLRTANLSSANLSGADLSGADLSGADLSGAYLITADLSNADLSGANLREAHLAMANLDEANLRGADLIKVDLFQAHFNRADLSGADLSNADLSSATLIAATLHETTLHETNLSSANLRKVDFRGAILRSADLHEADFRGANLSGTDLSNADLSGADLSNADLSSATLHGANLSGTTCVRTTFSGATLTSCNVYGISAWDLNLDGAKQKDLRITPLGKETNITADNLEVAQFLYLLLNNPKVRDVLDTITSKVVLILGRFSEERKPILDAVREALRSHPNGYIPVLFDFESQQDKPVFETVKTLANLARFVIADLTDPRMVRSELTYITSNVPTVPVQPIMQRDAQLPPEYQTWTLYKSFLSAYRYTDLPHLLASLTDAVITPVEGHVHARRLSDSDSRDAIS